MEKDTLTQSKNVIEVNDLTFSYKADPGNKAIDNINLVVPKGQFVVIMGPSGAGKSTLAKEIVLRINHVLNTIKLEGFEKRQPATLPAGVF